MKDDKFFHYFLAVVAIAVVSLVLLHKGGNLDGAASLPLGKEQTSVFKSSCEDSDPQNKHYVYGTLRYGPIEYKDFCQGDKLFQWHCATSNTVQKTHGYDCPNGCRAGVCIS